MKYEEALEYIHSLEKFGIKPGMERITSLCRAFGDVHKKLRFIHVAGTNGKGSTSTMIANACSEASLKTGLFISPYVMDFRERIQINGEMIPKNRLCEIVEKMIPTADRMRETAESPTEFEFITAAALLYFYEEECDIVVLETGLGGRLDSTNIIDCPLASVITSVSFDHMGILGDTLTEISREKCGIIKENGITVSYPFQSDEALTVIQDTCLNRNNKLFIPDIKKLKILSKDIGGTCVSFGGLEFKVPLTGEHMVYNSAVAVTVLLSVRNERGISIPDEAIVKGIGKTVMPARMQVFGENPLVIIDGGHNAGCAEALKNTVQEFLKDRKIIGICGLMADKEYEKYVETVSEVMKKIYTVTVDNPRAIGAKELCDTAKKYCAAEWCETLAHAVEKALYDAGKDGVVLVCGSFYMVHDVCEILKNK